MVKNLGRHLYSMELTGLEVMMVRGNLMVARVMCSPQVGVSEGECAAPALVLLKLRESATWTTMKLWVETRCENGRGERAFGWLQSGNEGWIQEWKCFSRQIYIAAAFCSEKRA